MQQKFKWNKCSEILPNNAQDWLVVSYVRHIDGSSRSVRYCNMFIYFDPAKHIVDGKLMYADAECDYWSALPNLPVSAKLGVFNFEPAIIADPQIDK